MRPDVDQRINELRSQIDAFVDSAARRGLDVSEAVKELHVRLEEEIRTTYDNLTPMQQVQVARHPERPSTLDYIVRIFSDWVELHGDRKFGDDPAIVAGWARLGTRSVMVIGQQKGRDTKENVSRNFGMPHPEGYRKALRLMKQAEKFGRPVICFIDTPGAFPGLGSEERGIAESIACNLREMACLRVPIISPVIGEGMSGGALGIGVSDRIIMLEHSIYSVISPEGCAAILWRSAEHKVEAAQALRLTASDLVELGICDELVSEPPGGAHSDREAVADSIRSTLATALDELGRLDPEELVARRHAKYEAIGIWRELEK